MSATEADTAVSLVVKYVRRRQQREHVYRIGDFANLTMDDGVIIRGFIREIKNEGMIISSNFVSFDSIKKLKIKGVKRRNVAGGVLLGLGIYSTATGGILLHSSNQDPTLGGAAIKGFAGITALAGGVIYTAIGAIVISSFGRLDVFKDGVEFRVIEP